MTYDDYYSSDSINCRAANEVRDDLHDFNNEIADRETGKISRFVSDTVRERKNGKATSQKALQSALALMLFDPSYAATYQDTMNAVTDAEDAVYTALVESADRLQDASDALEDAIGRSANEEEIARFQKDHDETKERHKRMLEHEARIQDIRARMEDKHNPPTQDKMDDFKRELGAIKTDADISVENKQNLETTSEPNIAAPDLDLSGFTLS